MMGTIEEDLEFVKGGYVIMAAQTVIQQQAKRIWYFVTVQIVALLGWIVVQSTFSLAFRPTNPICRNTDRRSHLVGRYPYHHVPHVPLLIQALHPVRP